MVGANDVKKSEIGWTAPSETVVLCNIYPRGKRLALARWFILGRRLDHRYFWHSLWTPWKAAEPIQVVGVRGCRDHGMCIYLLGTSNKSGQVILLHPFSLKILWRNMCRILYRDIRGPQPPSSCWQHECERLTLPFPLWCLGQVLPLWGASLQNRQEACLHSDSEHSKTGSSSSR